MTRAPRHDRRSGMDWPAAAQLVILTVQVALLVLEAVVLCLALLTSH